MEIDEVTQEMVEGLRHGASLMSYVGLVALCDDALKGGPASADWVRCARHIASEGAESALLHHRQIDLHLHLRRHRGRAVSEIVLRRVKNHYLVDGDGDSAYGPIAPRRLPEAARRFWERYGLGSAEEAVGAYADGALVGFFRYSTSERTLVAGGTWVAPSARRRKLAERMWRRALAAREHSAIKQIEVVAATGAGYAFVRYLRRTIAGYEWIV